MQSMLFCFFICSCLGWKRLSALFAWFFTWKWLQRFFAGQILSPQVKLCACFEITRSIGKLGLQLLNSINSFLMHSLFVRIQIAHWRGMIAAFSVIWFDITLQKFLFCVFAGLSKMLFGSECFITRCARNIFFTVDIPVMLCECFLGLELFATDITNKVRSHYCEFWFLQLLWSSSGECLFQTDSEAVSWNFHFSYDRSNP